MSVPAPSADPFRRAHSWWRVVLDDLGRADVAVATRLLLVAEHHHHVDASRRTANTHQPRRIRARTHELLVGRTEDRADRLLLKLGGEGEAGRGPGQVSSSLLGRGERELLLFDERKPRLRLLNGGRHTSTTENLLLVKLLLKELLLMMLLQELRIMMLLDKLLLHEGLFGCHRLQSNVRVEGTGRRNTSGGGRGKLAGRSSVADMNDGRDVLGRRCTRDVQLALAADGCGSFLASFGWGMGGRALAAHLLDETVPSLYEEPMVVRPRLGTTGNSAEPPAIQLAREGRVLGLLVEVLRQNSLLECFLAVDDEPATVGQPAEEGGVESIRVSETYYHGESDEANASSSRTTWTHLMISEFSSLSSISIS